MKTHGWHAIQNQSHQLLSQAIDRICNLTGLPHLYPLDSDLYHQMGIAPLPADVDLIDLKRRLYDEYRIEVPLIRWNEQQFIRISIQAYNLPSDVDILVDALRTLLS